MPERPMPRPGTEEARAALRIMEWAYEHPEPEENDREAVLEYRRFVDEGLGAGEDRWREAYDLALSIWERGYKRHQSRVERAMELF